MAIVHYPSQGKHARNETQRACGCHHFPDEAASSNEIRPSKHKRTEARMNSETEAAHTGPSWVYAR